MHTNIILQSPKYDKEDISISRRGPNKKLTLEQEFLMIMMRLRLGLLVDDLAFRFKTSNTRVSQLQTVIKRIAIFDNLVFKRSNLCYLTGMF